MDKIINNNMVLVNLLVPSLLNPSNELYIGKITIAQLEELLAVDINKDGWTDVVWSALSIAQALYIKNNLKGVK